jgi:hypothetical protein
MSFSTSTRLSPKAALASRRALAAARPRLDEHGIADLARLGGEHDEFLRLAVIAGHHGHAGLFHELLGGVLQPHGADRARRRPDEDEAGLLHRLHEIRVLRQEPVARMDRLRARRPGCLDDAARLQVALARGRGADMHRLVGHRHMHGPRIGIGIDGDGGDAHPPCRAHDADGDLAAVGDQYLPEHPASSKSRSFDLHDL